MKTLILATTLLGLLAIPGTSRAEKVRLTVKVVEASNQGKTVDPRLAHMARDFKNRFSYTSLKLVSESSAALDPKGSTTVKLPNGRTAQITFTGFGAGKTLSMHIAISGMVNLNYTSRNGASFYQGAGPANGQPGSQIFLAVDHALQ